MKKLLRVIFVALAAALLVALSAVAATATGRGGSSGYDGYEAKQHGDHDHGSKEKRPTLAYSYSSERSNAQGLDGAELIGGDHVAVFLVPLEFRADRVKFYVNGHKVNTEYYRPYDLLGTGRDGAANLISTDEFRDGENKITAKIYPRKGDSYRISAKFNKRRADPKIDVQMWVNGQDADSPPGPTVDVGDTVTFSYKVTNTGNTTLSNIAVDDDALGRVTCNFGSLVPGAMGNCADVVTTATTTGSMSGRAVGRGDSPQGVTVSDHDPVNYVVVQPHRPKIQLRKSVNGLDADSPPGPTVTVGDSVRFSYTVTNTGNTPLSKIGIVDDTLGRISCDVGTLQPSASFDCPDVTKTVTAAGPAYMRAVVEGVSPLGVTVSDDDPVNYLVVERPAPEIHVQMSVNGLDADSPPGPTVNVGDTVRFGYTVTNSGNTPLSNITVNDDTLGPITCDVGTLQPEAVFRCPAVTTTATTTGAMSGRAVVRGDSPQGVTVSDRDPVNYVVVKPAPPVVIKGSVKDINGANVPDSTTDLFESDGVSTRGRFIDADDTGGDGAYRYDVGSGCYAVVLISPDSHHWMANGGKYREHHFCLDPGQTKTIDGVLVPRK